MVWCQDMSDGRDVPRYGVQLKIRTQYPTGKQHTIQLHVTRKNQFKVVFPKQYAQPPVKSRPCTTFSNLLGVSVALCTRIGNALKAVVQQFATVEDGVEWCAMEASME